MSCFALSCIPSSRRCAEKARSPARFPFRPCDSVFHALCSNASKRERQAVFLADKADVPLIHIDHPLLYCVGFLSYGPCRIAHSLPPRSLSCALDALRCIRQEKHCIGCAVDSLWNPTACIDDNLRQNTDTTFDLCGNILLRDDKEYAAETILFLYAITDFGWEGVSGYLQWHHQKSLGGNEDLPEERPRQGDSVRLTLGGWKKTAGIIQRFYSILSERNHSTIARMSE